MERASSKLSQLLAEQRRAVREDADEPFAHVARANLNMSVVAHDVDTSPITSPENLANTRRRLSRMLTTKDMSMRDDSVVDVSFQRRELFTSTIHPTIGHDPKPTTTTIRKPARDSNAFYAVSNATPIRARKRVTIEERKVQPEDLPKSQKLNRVQKRTLTRSRSLSPLPTRYNQHNPSHHPQRSMHDMDVEEDDSVFQVDFSAFQDADRKLVGRFAAISAAADLRLLHAEVDTAAATLTPVGVVSARYWALDDMNGTLSTLQGDGSTATLNPYQTELLMDFTKDSIQAFGADNADTLLNPSSVFTWLPTHPAYQAVVKLATHGHSGRRLDPTYSMTHSQSSEQTASNAAKVVVHAVKVTSRSIDSPRFGKTVGILLVTEFVDSTLPFASALGIQDHNMLKLRRYLVLQLVQKLALAVETRVTVFDAQQQQAELVRFIEDTRSALGQKDLDLHQKDGIIATRESVLRAKDVHTLCSDALATCAALLSDAKLQSSLVASAVAKSGCIRDKSQHSLSNCWVLFKENDYNLSAAGSMTSHYPSEHQTVCAISGFLRDGHSPVSLISAQNKLVTRLLYGDHTPQSALRVSATRQELHDAGLVIADLDHAKTDGPLQQWAQSFTALAVSMQVSLVDRLAYNCPGQCNALAAVVIIVPEGEEAELFASHAVSLAHLAQRGFASVQAWYESTLRQGLLGISTELYEAVTTVVPAPASDSYASPQKARTGSAVPSPSPAPGPVSHQPHYQRALTALMGKLASPEVAAKFAVRKSALVVSDICAAHWKLFAPPAEARKLSFLQGVGGSLQTLACPTIDLSATSWLQDLYSGKIVYYDRAENQHAFAAAMPEAFNVEQSLRGSVTKQSRLVSPPHVQAQQLLKTFVQAVDPHAAYCALIPIRLASGLSVLMLFDKVTAMPSASQAAVAVSAARGDVTPFSAAYMEALLTAGVCKDLTQAMVIIQQQSGAYWAERGLSEDIETLSAREETLCALVASTRRRATVGLCFARWRHAATRSADQLALSKHRNVLSAVLALTTHRSHGEASDCVASFVSVLEEQLRILYPLDSITVTTSASQSAHAPSASSAAREVHLSEDAAHVTLQREVAYIVHDGGPAPVLTSPKAVRRQLATVRVSRPVMLNRPFLPGEVEDLGVFCSIAEEVYAALALGHSNDHADGDVRSLVFPMLRELVPGLLSITKPGQVHTLLPLVVRWLKRICAADMVLLRLNAAQGGGDGEVMLSSEELDSAVIERLRSKLGGLSDLAALLAPGADGGTLSDHSAQAPSDHILLKLLQRDTQGGSAGMGEVKVLSSTKRQFSSEQSVVAQVVAYLLAYVLRVDAQFAEAAEREALLVSERQQLLGALAAAKQTLQTEAQSSDAFKARLANLLSTIMLTDKIAAVTTLEDLAALVCDGVPRLVGVSSAALLVEAQYTAPEGAAKTPSGTFRVVLPRSNRASDAMDTSGHTAAANSTMSIQQLQQIPSMFAVPPAAQCKIDLLAPHNDSVFGSVLLFHKPLPTASSTSAVTAKEQEAASTTFALWEGLEDILRNALSTAIFQCTTRVAAAREKDELARALQRSNAILQDQAHLEPDVANLLGIKADLEEQRSALQSEVSGLRTKIDQILADRKAKLEALEGEITTLKAQSAATVERSRRDLAVLEESLASERAAHAALGATKQRLLELVSSYSFDQRCELDNIVLWLREVADGASVSLHMVGQTEGGALTGAEGVRGIVAAVGEAVRTGMTVEFTSTTSPAGGGVSPSQHDTTLPTSAALRYSRSDGRSADALQLLSFSSPPAAGAAARGSRSVLPRSADRPPPNPDYVPEHVAVLCVPNRSVGAHIHTDYACFVFVKTVHSPDGTFSSEERDLLNCAANLSSRTLVQTAAQQSEKEFRRLEASLRDARLTEAYLKRVIALADDLRRQEYATFEDVKVRVDMAVQELLQRGDRDTCLAEATLWLPPWNSAADGPSIVVRSSSAVSADQDALARVLSTGQRVRRRSCCWMPLVNHRGEIRAILRTERRFSDHTEVSMDSPVSSIDGDGSLQPTLAHLVISDLEEEMLAVFSSLVVGLLERMDMVGEACQSVQQAGQAILALQAVKESIEDKCALEVSHRLQLEDTLKAAAEMLGLTHSARTATDQLLDATRKSILAFTSSVECFIIMPVAPGGPMQLSSEGDRAAYCTFTSDLPRELRVDLEPGDLEASAIQSFAMARAAPGGGAHPGSHGASLLTHTGMRHWQSWAVRHVRGRHIYELDESNAGDAVDVGPAPPQPTGDENLHALAVPFAMRSGAVAVISLVRRAAPFTAVDRECVTWVSKVLAYCLEVKGGEETIVESMQRVKHLQEELGQLRLIDSRLTAVEDSAAALEHTLCGAKYAPSLLRDLEAEKANAELAAEKVERAALEGITAATKAAFGSDSLADAWLDSASPAGWQGKMKGLPKTMISCGGGSVTYWIDPGAEVEESAASEAGAFRKEGETRLRFRRQQEAIHTDDVSVAQPTLFVLVNAHGYPKAWLEIIFEPKLQEHLKLRFAVLLQLLYAAQPWRGRALELHESLVVAKTALAVERDSVARLREEKKQEVEGLKASFATNLDGTKGRYKSIVLEKSVSYRRAERIFTETLVRAKALRGSARPDRGPGGGVTVVSADTLQMQLLDAFLQFGRSVETGGGLSVAVGKCPFSAYTASDSSPLLLAPLMRPPVATAPKRTVGNEVEGLEWFATPSPGLSPGSGQLPPSQPHTAIQVELYNGAAHTNPLQIAIATGRTILFLPEAVGGESPSSPSLAGARDALLSVCRQLDPDALRHGAAAAENYICLNPTDQFPLYSIIVPIALKELGVTILVVVKPGGDRSAQGVGEEVSKYVLYSALAGVFTLKQAALDLLQQQSVVSESANQSRSLAVQLLRQSALTADVARKTKALVFERMRTASLSAKLTVSRGVEVQLATTKAQVRHLEQLNADWTEMVKGLTGASGGIQTGVAGLWAQACPTLMGLLSSHVKLVSCGLIVPGDAEESAVEYTVRELSTPVSTHAGRQRRSSQFSPATVGEIEDYSRGALESRPARDLGNSVHSLALDILAGRTGSQRIFKLARGRAMGRGDGGNLWLVPVRTARTVLGVLRVSVDLAPTNEGGSDPAAEEIGTAQSNLINFAEVLAPLHLAAQALDRSKQLTARLEQDAHRAAESARANAQEVTTAHRRTALLANVAKCLGVLSRTELHLPYTAPEECLRIFCNRLAIELSQQLSGRVVIHIHRDILTGGGEPTNANDSLTGAHNAPASRGATITTSSKPGGLATGAESEFSEKLLDAQGRVFGSVSVLLNRTNTTEEGAEATARQLYKGQPHSNSTSAHVAYVLQAVSVALSGLLLRTAREISVKGQIASAEEAVRAAEEALRKEQEAAAQLQQAHEESIGQGDFYRGLAEVLHRCLDYCSADQDVRFKYPGDGDTYSFAQCSALVDTLGSFCNKLPPMVGNSCSFNFALLDSKKAITGDTGRRSGKQITWVHTGKEDSIRALDWYKLPPEARDMVQNLAHTCINKRVKSVCDIGVNFGQHVHVTQSTMGETMVERLTTVRVLSFPMVDPHSSTVLGVVQCLVEPSAVRPALENLCEDVTNCVTCVLSVEAHQQKLCGKTQQQKLKLLTAEMKVNESQQLKEMWQQRSRAWAGLCQLGIRLAHAATSDERFIDAIGSEAVVAIPSDTGVRVSLRPGPVSDAHRQVLGFGSKTILAHAVIPVTDAGDLVAEIVCEKESLGMTGAGEGVEGLGVATIATELVGTVENMLRDALTVHKLRQLQKGEVAKHSAHAAHKIDKLKSALRHANEQVQAASAESARVGQELQRQAERYEALKTSTTAAVTSVCNSPTVQTMTAQIKQLCEALGSGATSAGSAELSSILAEVVSKESGNAVPKQGFGESKQGDAGGTSGAQVAPDDASPVQFANTMTQPITELLATLRNALVSAVSLQEKRATAPLSIEAPSSPRSPSYANRGTQSPRRGLANKGTCTPPAAPGKTQTGTSTTEPAVLTHKMVEEMKQQIDHTLQQLSNTRKVHRVVCREAAILMDPPNTLRNDRDTHNYKHLPEPLHPAAVTPLEASHDSCLKVLSLLRTLLRSEGQALLLYDKSKPDRDDYQIIFSGDALTWPGLTPGVFGVVGTATDGDSPSPLRTSFTRTVMQTRKTLLTADAMMDARYYSFLDGVCTLGTPMLVVPVRGRSNAVVGVLIAARGKGAGVFSAEDIMAAETCSALGALSLYWCQGMGVLHHQMAVSAHRVIRLEKQLERLQSKGDEEEE